MQFRVFIMVLLISPAVFSQGRNEEITASFVDAPLDDILDSLSAQSGYFFSYNSDLLPKGSRYTIASERLPIDQFLSKLLVGTHLKYTFYKNQIIINYEAPEKPVAKRKKLFNLSGRVTDEQGAPLIGVNVFLDGTTVGTATNSDGDYLLERIPPGHYDVVFSFIGYEKGVYSLTEYNGGARIQSHQMNPKVSELNEIEVVAKRIVNTQDNWPVYFDIFKNDLFGSSANSKACSIVNPEVVNFLYDKETNKLTAFASEPIKI
ncbi:MAG: carboxypeptidase-like regulatory domain-containing protein, partial [Bacteroidota bacterium]